MYFENFIDHLHSQGCSWAFDTPSGMVYQNKYDGGSIIFKEMWVSAQYIRTVCAQLDIEVPPEIS